MHWRDCQFHIRMLCVAELQSTRIEFQQHARLIIARAEDPRLLAGVEEDGPAARGGERPRGARGGRAHT